MYFVFAMNRSLLVLLCLTLVLALAPTVHAAGSTGYVSYNIQTSSNGNQRSYSVNESVSQSSHSGESILSLIVKSASTNFTYSHLVNSSVVVFPYLPVITNRTLTYSNDSYSISIRLVQEGTSKVTFQGSQYTLNVYAVSANFTDADFSGNANGTLATFPSGLVYTAAITLGKGSLTATMTSTSLQLQASSAAPSIQIASAGIGVSVAAVAVVLSIGVRAKRKNGTEQAEKPEHWVD